MLVNLKKIFLALEKKELVVFTIAAITLIVCGVILTGIFLDKRTIVLPVSGGEYKEGIVGQPAYVNPVIAASVVDKGLMKLVFSNLNDLADQIDSDQDGRTWKIRLKENILWQDGQKLTSDDVIFTIQAIQNRSSNSSLIQNWQGVVAGRSSEIELQLSLSSPSAFLADSIKNLYILPKHLFASIPPSNWRLSDYNLKPIGSGPYQFLSYEKLNDGFITTYRLEANPNHFAGAPLIESFMFQFFQNNNDLIKSFNTGQLSGAAGFGAKFSNQISRPHNLAPSYLPTYYAIFFNQGQNPTLADIVVRKAINLAVDKQNLINTVLGGSGEVMDGPISPKSPYFNPDLPKDGFSPGAAIQILDQAGWVLNQDGIRTKDTKNDQMNLSFNLIVPKVDFLTETATLIKESLEKIGFKINLIIVPAEEITNNAIPNRNYEMLLFGNVLGAGPDLFSFWHSSQRLYPGFNLSLYNNKKSDSLIETIRQNLDSESRLQELYELQGIIANNYPAVFLYSPYYLFVTGKGLGGPAPVFIADPSDRFLNAKGWYLSAARVLKK